MDAGHSPGGTWIAVAMAVAMCPVAGLGEPAVDVLTRCHELAAFARGMARELPSICRPDRFPRGPPRPRLAANERVIWRPVAGEAPAWELTGSGRWAPPWPPPTRDELDLGRRSLAEPAGVGTYYAMHPDRDSLVRRDVAWLHPGGSAVLFYERERPWDGEAGGRLTGKWQGAYSRVRWVDGGGGRGVESAKAAGTVNAIGLQDGARWYAVLFLPEGTFRGTALVHENVLRWVGQREADGAPAWWSAAYGLEGDQVEGVLSAGTESTRSEYRLYLKRAARPL